MFAFLSENLATIVGSALVFGVFLLILVKQIKNHRQHKGGCGCGCSGCPNAGSCHPQ
ncbi:hypothetical protein SDC9_136661 [bioreactor metagenome]|uniref:FeoB-associated Cys-rich membrane protein n=1 Tax=bioreactor metagenome TaxID=1076179 RepID=A0A645DLW5_9ZZZZ|nr:FeoB-associated Cys-rich membrane protein [Candidatus Pelethousia sp.]